LTNKLGLLSNKQKLEKRKRYREEETSEIPQDWSSIRRKNIKDIMYQNFVLDMKKKYSLDMKQTKMLLAMLTLALLIKSIGPKDIIYENERIQEIQGIEFEKGSFAFSRPIYSKIYTSNSVEGESEERIDICQEWDKYIGELQTRMI
jgi:predicted nucleotidyltransferase